MVPNTADPWTILGRAAFALGVVVIVVLSILPSSSTPSIEVWDKAQHALAYLSVMLAGAVGYRRTRQRHVMAIVLIGLGCLLEVVQTQLPSRLGTPGDAVANAVGVIVGLCIVRFVEPWISTVYRTVRMTLLKPGGSVADASRRVHSRKDGDRPLHQ